MTLNLYTDPIEVIEKIKHLSPHTKTHNTSVSERKNDIALAYGRIIFTDHFLKSTYYILRN